MTNGNRLMKSMDRKIFGVAAGIAEHLNMDTMYVRLAFVLAFLLLHESVLVGYIVLALILPEAERDIDINIVVEKSPPAV